VKGLINDRNKLWKIFGELLISAGLDPEDYRKYFDEEYEMIKTKESVAQEKTIRALAKLAIQFKPKHPSPPSISALRKALHIREELDEAKQKVDPSDPASIEQYMERLKELKRQEEKVWHDLELKRSEIKAKGLEEGGRKIISITCLRCAKPLKYVIEFERGLCLECYDSL